MKKKRLLAGALSFALITTALPGGAGELEEVRALRDATLELVRALVAQGVLSKDKAAALIEQAQKAGTGGNETLTDATGKRIVRVPYVPETVKNEMREQIKQEVLSQARNERWGDPGALPDWLSRISWEGDFRLRGQLDRFPNDSVPNVPPAIAQINGININNTSASRNRLRVRARLGMNAQISDSISAGVRLATGGTGPGSDPVSTNQTLGTYGSRYTLGVDRAFIAYKPYEWASFSGGRIANPFFVPTDLVWDDDLNFEGVAAKFRPMLGDRLKGFLTFGAFPIQDIEPTPLTMAKTKWLYGYQGGFNWDFGAKSSATIGLALYDYRHMEGIRNPELESHVFDQTAPLIRQKGNSVFNIANSSDPNVFLYGLASKFKELNLSASADFAAFDPVHVIVDADFVKNIGFKREEILQRTGIDIAPKVRGYQTKVTVGLPKLEKRGDWQAFMGYRYVERDAVLDAFTDSDFHLGGTDTKGYFLGARYAFQKNTWLGMRWLSGKEIDGLPLSIDVLQLDLNTSF